MKAKKLLKVGLVLAATALVAGCKIEVVAVQGGDIEWEGGRCPEGSNCVIEITDPDFSKSFLVKPKPGYEFVHWRRGVWHLCRGDTSQRCNFTLPADDNDANTLIGIVRTLYVQPVYKEVSIDFDGDGLMTEKDLDDDGDGIYDVDDNCELTPLLVAVDTYGCPIP